MNNGAFKPHELDIKSNSPEEQHRAQEIFLKLKERAVSGDYLSEHEKNFFCKVVRLLTPKEGSIDDFECCANPKFKFLYLTYFMDLSGNSEYFKPNGLSLRKINGGEASLDLNYLDKKSQEWETIINRSNHSSRLLQEISTEARNELKDNRDKLGANDLIESYQSKKSTLLRLKFIYCTALEIFEVFNGSDLNIVLNGEVIDFNEYSLVHILNRHYSEITKQGNRKKDFHNEDFKPRLLGSQLEEVIKSIDSSKVLLGKSIDKIAFQIEGINYLIWTSIESKSLKGKGNILYRRLNTFFPVSEEKELDKLRTDYTLTSISKSISVYIPK